MAIFSEVPFSFFNMFWAISPSPFYRQFPLPVLSRTPCTPIPPLLPDIYMYVYCMCKPRLAPPCRVDTTQICYNFVKQSCNNPNGGIVYQNDNETQIGITNFFNKKKDFLSKGNLGHSFYILGIIFLYINISLWISN